MRPLISFAGLGGALGECPHLGGDDGKSAARFARTCSFDAGVEGKQVGLEGDLVDDADDVADLLRGALDVAHRRDRLAHHFVALLGIRFRRGDDFAGMACAVGGLLHRCSDLIERSRGLLEARRLLRRAPRLVVGRRRDLVGREPDGLRAGSDRDERVLQACSRGVEVVADLLVVLGERRAEPEREVALREPLERGGEVAHEGVVRLDIVLAFGLLLAALLFAGHAGGLSLLLKRCFSIAACLKVSTACAISPISSVRSSAGTWMVLSPAASALTAVVILLSGRAIVRDSHQPAMSAMPIASRLPRIWVTCE